MEKFIGLDKNDLILYVYFSENPGCTLMQAGQALRGISDLDIGESSAKLLERNLIKYSQNNGDIAVFLCRR